MGYSPRAAPLPPRRKWWVERMSDADKRSHLIVEHLERVAGNKAKAEVRAIRGFLAAWIRATRGGNPLAFTLKVERAKANIAVVFVWSPHAGPIRWLPVIVVPWSHHLERISRECGDMPRFWSAPERTNDSWGETDKKTRPPVLPKVQVELIRPH